MGGCRCSYKNCTNTTKTRENLHFFHYPVKHKERCMQWIENAQKPQFYNLDEDQLRNKVICETHFKDSHFPNFQKKRLLQGAVPTLEGDCVSASLPKPPPQPPQPKPVKKINHDVQVLPANADGTIFVLETSNMQIRPSEKIESYIYTNSGLVLPISKCSDVNGSVQHMYTENSSEEIGEINSINQYNMKVEHPEVPSSLNSSCENLTQFESVNFVVQPENHSLGEDFEMNTLEESAAAAAGAGRNVIIHKQEIIKSHQSPPKISESQVYQDMENKYAKTLRQHSREIAKIKRILRTRTSQKPSNVTIMNSLKRQLPTGLSSLVHLQLGGNVELSPEDIEFFSVIHSTSPELYQILSQRFKWRLPSPDVLKLNRNNGYVNTNDM